MAAAAQSGAFPPAKSVAVPYAAFLAAASLTACTVGELGPSVFLTLGAMAQCLALALLWGGCSAAGGCPTGYSAQSLALVAVSLALRLSSTLWLNGYLPADSSGDGLYQAVDVVSLVLAVALLRRVHRSRCLRKQQQQQPVEENVQVLMLGAPAALLLAAALHGDMNSRPLFDTLWMAGHFLGAAASFPQLWLSSSQAAAPQQGGGDEATEGENRVGHFLSVMAMSQLLTVVYMWLARDDISCQPWLEGFNHTIWAIIAPSVAHLLLVSDAMPQLPSL